jgi:type IV secretory pathway VirB4 component
MQLINSDQQYVSTSNLVNEQWQQILALEKAQDEIELLREQVNFLQEYLSEQLQQQQAVEQKLHHVNQGLALMNAENQQLVEANRLFFEEIKEFARTLPADGETSRKALTRLLSKFYDEIAPSEELESVRFTLRSKEYAA